MLAPNPKAKTTRANVARNATSPSVDDVIRAHLREAASAARSAASEASGEELIRLAALTSIICSVDRALETSTTPSLREWARRMHVFADSDAELGSDVGGLLDRAEFGRLASNVVRLLLLRHPGDPDSAESIVTHLADSLGEVRPDVVQLAPTTGRRIAAVKAVRTYLTRTDARRLGDRHAEAIVRRVLIAFGYPRRQANALYERVRVDDSPAERQARRLARLRSKPEPRTASAQRRRARTIAELARGQHG